MAGGLTGGSKASASTFGALKGWLLLPSWLVIGIFLVVPVGTMVVYSFLTKEFRGGVIWEFSLADAHLTIFWRSIKLSFMTTVTTLVFGFPTAYFIATRPPEQRNMWVLLVTVPYWINLLIRTVSMKFLIRDSGPLNEFLQATGLIDGPIQLVNTNIAVQLGLFYSYLPFMVLPIYASVERYNFALSEAAADLYADRWTILREVLIPSVKPGIVAGCILVFVPSLGAFLAPDLLGGAKTFMIGSLIEEQFKGNAGNWPFGAAASVVLMTMVLAVLLFYARQQGREDR